MRVTTGTVRRKRHKKILKSTKGYRMTYSKTYRRAHEAFMHAGQYAYAHRRERKGDMRRLWMMRINAGLRELGFKYKDFVHKAKLGNVMLDRKVLADLVVKEPEVFAAVAKKVMG